MKGALALLTPSERRKYRVAVLLQMATSFLDLAGILLFGVVGVIASSAAAGTTPPSSVQSFLDLTNLSGVSPVTLSLVLSAVAAVLLLLKGFITMFINWRVGRFLARCSYRLSQSLGAAFFNLPLLKIQKYPTQFCGYGLSNGVNAIMVDVLGNSMVLRTEVALLVVLGAALLLLDPLTTLIVIVYFGLVILMLSRGLRRWARSAGEVLADTEIATVRTVQDAISTYREVTVAGRRDFYLDRYLGMRYRSSQAMADQRFVMQLPRYVMEIAMVLGAAILVVSLVLLRDSENAVGSLVLFLAASSRVMPSLLRLNSARLALHAQQGRSERTFAIVELCEGSSPERQLPGAERASGIQAEPVPLEIVADNVTVAYPQAADPAVDGLTFTVPAGSSLALVGPSGAGKSTLTDAILGVVQPTSGEIWLGGESVREVIKARPGAIAYVPQDVALVHGTVRENVALGILADDIDDDRVWDALERASLAAFLRESREGLDTVVGERGVRLSGGQRQRLGIARALYSQPSLIVLDEATSALDAETEHVVTGMLSAVGDDVTTVTVAHRLATIREADLVIYMEEGRMMAAGSFDEVRAAVSSFDRQANLLGL